MIRRSWRVILPCTLGSRTLTLAPPVAANGNAPVMAMSMFHTSSPSSTVRNMCYWTVIILLKGTVCYSNPIHFLTNYANCSSQSSKCPSSIHHQDVPEVPLYLCLSFCMFNKCVCQSAYTHMMYESILRKKTKLVS